MSRSSEPLRYQTPFELDPDDEGIRSGRTALSEFALLKVVGRWEAGDETHPMLVDATGTPPP